MAATQSVEAPVRVRVLVLTAAFGDGHNSAARHVALALEQSGADAEVVDLLQEASPWLATLLRGGYRAAITHWPWAWRRLYRWADKVSYEAKGWDLFGGLAEVLAQRLGRQPVDLLVSTYPLYAHLLQRLRHQPRTGWSLRVPPLATVVTDCGQINRAWIGAQSDWFLVPDEATGDYLATLGVPRSEIVALGFPVHPDFARPLDPPVERRRGVLYFPLNRGRAIRRTLEYLVPVLRRHQEPLTVVLGRHHARLYHLFRAFVENHPELEIEVLGWTDQIPRLLRTHRLVIGKSGGASVQEVLAAACPMVINYVVPGQEEGNARLLEQIGGGRLASSPAAVAGLVDQWLGAPEDGLLRDMGRRLAATARPRSALDVAAFLLDKVSGEMAPVKPPLKDPADHAPHLTRRH